MLVAKIRHKSDESAFHSAILNVLHLTNTGDQQFCNTNGAYVSLKSITARATRGVSI